MKKNRLYRPAAVLVTILAIVLLLGGVLAKYIYSVAIPVNVTFSANLAEDFRLFEHKVEKQEDGTYLLGTEEVSGNQYTVLPGVDIPKDPQIVITKKSAVASYLYIEVIENCPTGIFFELTDNWISVPDIQGKNGGKVYVYSMDFTNPAVIDGSFPKEAVPIIKNSKIVVSDSIQNLDPFSVAFYGYLTQVIENKTASEIFINTFGAIKQEATNE